jgi:hypothetical protein
VQSVSWRRHAYRNVISGLEITADLSFNAVKIEAKPKCPNLLPFECVTVQQFSFWKNSLSKQALEVFLTCDLRGNKVRMTDLLLGKSV